MRYVLRSKIYNATVTEANINYKGSITIDEALIKKAGFWLGEKVTPIFIVGALVIMIGVTLAEKRKRRRN